MPNILSRMLTLLLTTLFTTTATLPYRPVPANLRALISSVRAQGSCASPFPGRFHSQTGDAARSVYCADRLSSDGIIYLQSARGQLVNMDIDCDGDQRPSRPGNDGRCGPSRDTQNQTSFGYIAAGYRGVQIEELNAFVHAYAVFGNVGHKGNNFRPQRHGVRPLSLMAVVCPTPQGDKLVYGVWGDENGGDGQAVVGEAGIGLATLCYGDAVTGNNGHDEKDVMFIAFTGDRAVPGADGADWNAQSLADFEQSLFALGDELVAGIGQR